MLHGTDGARGDDVMMEFLGEGVYAPACMLRKDGFKYVYCRHDPPLLFDLGADPDERVNLADRPEHAALESRLRREVLNRWDYPALEQRVLQSQRRRLFAQESLLKGSWTAWDYQPPADAARQYVRGAVDPNTTATKARMRFPFVAEVPPDHPRDPAADLQVGPPDRAAGPALP
jgi:choline-sulfatase